MSNKNNSLVNVFEDRLAKICHLSQALAG